MRRLLVLGSVLLALSGCVTVPVWVRDVEQLDKMGKGLSVAEVDKVFGRTTLLASKTVEVDGKTYLFRHYELAVPTGRFKTQTTCYQQGGCISSHTPINRMEPFAVVYVGEPPRLLAWGKLIDLQSSKDPELTPVLQQLHASYMAYRYKR